MKTIADFKNRHEGKRLFILASGPSLNDLDLSHLKRRMVMGLNRSFLIFPDTYYQCVMDFRLFDEFQVHLEKTRHLFTLEGRPWGTPIKLLGAEDFSYMLQARPGAFIFLGNGDTAQCHHPAYNFDDEAIPAGSSWYSGMIEARMPA